MKVNRCINCNSNKLSEVNRRVDNNPILECSACKMLMVGELNDDTESLYTKDYFEKDKATKFGYDNYLSSPVANIVGKFGLPALFVEPGSTHLDLGCADGSLVEIFNEKEYISRGLEISKDAVRLGSEKGLDIRYSNLKGFPKDLPKSDLITAFDLLEHSDAPARVTQEAYDNLNDDGYFVFSTLAVEKEDPEDYWFNNSLEHYAYYNEDNLQRMLGDVFGSNNIAFKAVSNNGIVEFWGVAKKGELGAKKEVIDLIGKDDILKILNSEQAFLLSLFYNQVSLFKESSKVIKRFGEKWDASDLIEAQFYNYYYEGRFQKAIDLADRSAETMPLSSSIYWQALSDVQSRMSAIYRDEGSVEHKRQANQIELLDKDIDSINDELAKSKDDLSRANLELEDLGKEFYYASSLVNSYETSKFIGPVIKLRSQKGRVVGKLSRVKQQLFHKAKTILPESVVERVKLKIHPENKFQYVENKKYETKDPLVSVVITYYNRSSVIADTIGSLEKQSFVDFEVILVDDGSSEPNTDKVLKDLAEIDLNLTVIRQKNAGVAVARNVGMAKARGRYIVSLDSDDMFDPLYIEKCVAALEVDRTSDIATTSIKTFGVVEENIDHNKFDPFKQLDNNQLITSALFRREALESSTGYTSDLGYEDWEFWITLIEAGHWPRLIPERLFIYRTAAESRFIDDRKKHSVNVNKIRSMHPEYKQKVAAIVETRKEGRYLASPETSFINISSVDQYTSTNSAQPNVLITMPWMTFGGAETLMLNFCSGLDKEFNITFMTGLESQHEWEDKFKDISERIYHLPNLFDDKKYYIEFISNYIKTRAIKIFHIVHTDFPLGMLPELKKRHPDLKVVVTMFNTRVKDYFDKSIKYFEYIDQYSSDNNAVKNTYEDAFKGTNVRVIPNGVDCENRFTPNKETRKRIRQELGLSKDQLAVFYIGRLSEEKNPQAVVDVASRSYKNKELDNMQFFIVGDGQDRASVDKLTAAGTGNFKDLGYQDKVEDYLAAADIFLLPSFIEGFPLSILEAMGSEAVPVASSVGAVPDVIEDRKSGYLVDPAGSADVIYSILEEISKNPKVLPEMKKVIRKESVDKYSLKRLGENYIDMYKNLLK